ncbi:glycosyltransferase family 2 protein [Deltaproteobacteria bacterium]|nr:glycosyltransferase family 2 protein [Deltaproteobacteria bacterium]
MDKLNPYKQKEKTLAVVIPCFNNSETLDRALRSIFSQTRIPDEVIVVDDCSKDIRAIMSIVKKFDDVQLIRNKQNIGPSATRNVGIWECNSDIVTFLDADDECHEARFELQLNYAYNNSAVTCSSINPDREEIPNINLLNPCVSIHRSLLRFITFNRFVGASLMISVSLIKNIGGYDESIRNCEDYDLWLRLLFHGCTVTHVKENLYFYYDTPDSLSKNIRSISELSLFVVCRIINQSENKFWNMFMLMIVLFKSVLMLQMAGYEKIKISDIIHNSCIKKESIQYRIINFLYIIKIIGLFGKLLKFIRALANYKTFTYLTK